MTRSSRLGGALALLAVLSVPAAARAQVETGKYTGDAFDGHFISLTFRPEVLVVQSADVGGPVLCTSSMLPDRAKILATSDPLASGLVLSLEPDGFRLGSNPAVNGFGVTYYWVAFRPSAQLAVGSYVATGASSTPISVGFLPVAVLVVPEASYMSTLRTASSGADAYRINGALEGDAITQLNDDGFQVGAIGDVAESGQTYHYLAWAAGRGVAEGGYRGDGNDDRSISEVGFPPEYVLVKGMEASGTSANAAAHRPASIEAGVDLSLAVNTKPPEANNIQALEANGFQVGTHSRVNANGQNYVWLAFANLTDGGTGGSSPDADTSGSLARLSYRASPCGCAGGAGAAFPLLSVLLWTGSQWVRRVRPST